MAIETRFLCMEKARHHPFFEKIEQIRFRDLIEALRQDLGSLKTHAAYTKRQLRYLAENGYALEAKRIKYVHGRPGKCLETAQENLRKHPNWTLWVGFALSQEGYWYAHAWNRTAKGSIVESDEIAPEIYYGINLPSMEGWKIRRGHAGKFSIKKARA